MFWSSTFLLLLPSLRYSCLGTCLSRLFLSIPFFLFENPIFASHLFVTARRSLNANIWDEYGWRRPWKLQHPRGR
jgi:hypothetical protein